MAKLYFSQLSLYSRPLPSLPSPRRCYNLSAAFPWTWAWLLLQ